MDASPQYWSPAPLLVDTTASSSCSTQHGQDSPSTSGSPSLPANDLVKRLRKAPSKAKLNGGDGNEETKATSSKIRTRPADKRGNPPRPANAWICYRSARVHELKASSEYAKLPQADISKIIGQLWRNEPPEVRRQYEDMAALKKAEHKEKHPDYVFRPVRRTSTKRTPKPKTAPCPPPAPMPGSVPSVLQRPPSPSSTPPTSYGSFPEPLCGILTAAELSLPTPAFSPADLPVPPPLSSLPHPVAQSLNQWTYVSCAENHLPLSPAWTPYDAPTSFSFDSLTPSQLELPSLPTFSPTLQHANSFLEGAYLTPPPSATDFDEMWAAATAGSEFIEIPASSFRI
ncbi:hypothetical protein JCM6882_008299 [Rhodosporidiobolus microsporus]